MEPKKNRVVFKEVMNAKNKNNMKRHLHFYQWLLCLLLTMGCHLFAYSQGKVTCLEDLQAGDVIKIYPYGHYDEASRHCHVKAMEWIWHLMLRQAKVVNGL